MQVITKTTEQEMKKEIIELLHSYRNTQKKIKRKGYIPTNTEFLTSKMREELKFKYSVEEALSLLSEEECLLLTYRYIENNGETFDYIVRNKLAVSERTYYRIKHDALINLYELLF